MEIILAVKLGFVPGTKIKVESFPAMFGSGAENTFAFSERGVASQHFIINEKNNKIFLRPLDEAITRVNNLIVEDKVELTNHDYITVSEDLILQVHFKKKTSRRTSKGYDQIKMEPGGVLRRRIDVDKTSILEPSTQKLKYSHRALKTIYAVLRKCNNESNDELLFDRLLDALFKAIDAERGAIFLQIDKDNYEGKAFLTSTQERDPFPVSTTVLKDVMQNRVSIISHIPEDDRLSSSESMRLQMVGSFICAPLISYEKIFGALYLDRTILHNQPTLVEEEEDNYPEPFFIEDLELLVAIGIQIGSSLAKSLLIRKVRQSLYEKEKLVQALRESEERYALAASAANDGLWDCDIQTAKVYYSTRWKAMLGYQDSEIQDNIDEWFDRVHEEDFGKVKDEFNQHIAGKLPRFQIEHRMLHRDGNYIWVLNQGIAVRDQNNKTLRVVGSQTDITKRKQAEAQLLHDAFYDVLTGLPNRALLMSRLQRAIYRANRDEKYMFAVLFMDLDSFKVVNDSMGHVTGDELLIDIAKRLQQVIRPGDTVARFGGDEFTILLENLQSLEQASEVANILHEQLAEPFTLNEQDFFMGASIGIAIGSVDYEEPQDLLRDADTAMYRAKSNGNPYEVFDRQMHESVTALLRLETDLRKSLVEKDFFLCYQPIVDLKTFQITGMESLMRWHHQDRGLVSPGEFIPLAERTKLIVDLGWWAIREACQQLAHFQKEFSRPDLSVSVNMSAKQFAIHDLGRLIEDVLRNACINPDNLKLEITETVLMENAKAMIKTLTDLKLMNIDLYIDDFGTGYSSLSYLHRFPISILKVDRSFVFEITKKENYEIVRTIITLAHNLDMKVVAEGIETSEQLKLLMQLGCDFGQGNLFSPPVKSHEIAKMLSKSHRWDFLQEVLMSDALFGKAAVLLDYITPQQLNEALQHKEQFAKVQLDMELAQILVNKNYIAKNLVEEIRDYANKLPQNVHSSTPTGENIPKQYQKKIGRYFIISNLGKGAMGDVFKAYDPHLDRIIALKVLTSLENENNVERFQREARTMAQLTHPNIVAVYDIANEDKQYFFSMDLIEGQTLDQLLQNNTLEYDEILTIILKIASAIEYAHSHGVIHRDLKPANILLTHDNEPKVTDFGLAKVAHEDQKLSQKGMIIGTLQYMPPEQAEGNLRLIDQRSDIYSLGAILYEMITSFPPFSAPTFNQLVKKIIKEDPILPRGIRPNVPKQIEAICLKALNKRRENRYQNAKEFIWDLKCFQQGDSIQASAIHLQKLLIHQLRRHRNLAISVASGLILLLVIWFLFFSGSSQDYLQNTLQKVVRARNNFTTVEALQKKYDFTQPPSAKAMREIELTLLNTMEFYTLVSQALAVDHYNDELQQTKKMLQNQLLQLSLLTENKLLSEAFIKYFYRDEEKKLYKKNILPALKLREKNTRREVGDIFRNLQHKVPEEIITAYANRIRFLPAQSVIPPLIANIRSNDVLKAKLAIRGLAALNTKDKKVVLKLRRDLKSFVKKNNKIRAKETVRALALLKQDIGISKSELLQIYDKGEQQQILRIIHWGHLHSAEGDASQLGKTYFALGEFQRAIPILEKDPAAKKLLAQAYLRLGQLSKAKAYREQFEQDEELCNINAEILIAEEKLTSIVNPEPTLFKNRTQQTYYTGIAYAMQDANPLVTDFPVLSRIHETSDFLMYEGIFYRKRNKFEKAFAALFRAKDFTATPANIYLEIGRTALKKKDMHSAVWYIEKARLYAPQNSETFLGLAEVYFAQRNWSKCIFLLTQYVAKERDSEKAHLLMAQSYLALAENDAATIHKMAQLAVNHLDKVLEVDKDNAQGYFWRATAYEHLREYEKALKDVRSAKSRIRSKIFMNKLRNLYRQIKEKQRVE